MADPVVTVRRATQNDSPALEAIARGAYAPYRSMGLRLPPVDEGMADDIDRHTVFVACMDGWPCGFVVLAVTAPEAHLINLAVSPDAKGGGIGRRLLAVASDTARASGATRIALATHCAMTDTIAVYRHLGWVQTGAEGDKVFMTLDLSDQADRT